MTKKRTKVAIAVSTVVAGLLMGAGVVYASSDGPDVCGPVPQLSAAVGPNGAAADDTEVGDGAPLCVRPVPALPPLSS